MDKRSKESVKKKKIKLHLLRNALVLHQIESATAAMPLCCASSNSFKTRIVERTSYTFEEYTRLVESPYILYDNAVWMILCSNADGSLLSADYSFSPYFQALEVNIQQRRSPEDASWMDLLVAYGPFIDLEEAARRKTQLTSFKTLPDMLCEIERDWREGHIHELLWHIVPTFAESVLRLMFLPRPLVNTTDRHHIPASSSVELAVSGS
jgi:hypothetical protein